MHHHTCCEKGTVKRQQELPSQICATSVVFETTGSRSARTMSRLFAFDHFPHRTTAMTYELAISPSI